MLRFEPSPHVVVCLHFLGGSARSWSEVVAKLAWRFSCLSLDLPGFGCAADAGAYTVEAMADDVAARVRRLGLGRWTIAGHSMGAKVAAVLARRAEDGEAGLEGLRGLVLVAGSPPSPEPMEDDKRQAMLGWFTGGEAAWPDQARGYIDANLAAPLDPAVHERAVADVLRMQPDAWAAWLHNGSREDWSDRVGLLRTPAAILYGAEDAALGEAAQRRLMAPHFASHRLVKLTGAAHLLPMERPDAVAELIADHVGSDRVAR
jgi:pimeloyl-ACP methyl ester carboxylesterase